MEISRLAAPRSRGHLVSFRGSRRNVEGLFSSSTLERRAVVEDRWTSRLRHRSCCTSSRARRANSTQCSKPSSRMERAYAEPDRQPVSLRRGCVPRRCDGRCSDDLCGGARWLSNPLRDASWVPSMAWNIGCSSPGELLMTRESSVAACRSNASLRSRCASDLLVGERLSLLTINRYGADEFALFDHGNHQNP